jgi:hypothetical protein
MRKIALFFGVVVGIAALTAFCSVRWVAGRHDGAPADAQEWLHSELNLTNAQRIALAPIEREFAVKQRELADRLRAANRDLARTMGEEKAYTPKVTAAVQCVHHCMSELQMATIEHVFAMRSVLAQDQGDKLLTLAQRSLEQTP